MIVTKKNFIKFYVSLVIMSLVNFGLGSLMLYVSFKIFQSGNIKLDTFFMFFFALVFFYIGAYFILKYIKKAPKIRIDNTSIFFGSEKYMLADIKKVKLTGKIPFKFLKTFYKEGALIKFKNGTKKYIYDDMYSNTWQVKLFLEKVVIKNEVYQRPKVIRINDFELKKQLQKVYKNFHSTSLRGINFWLITTLLSTLIFFKYDTLTPVFWVSFSLFMPFWVFFNSWLGHFFCLSKDFFIVKNHIFIWKSSIFHISEIKEIIFETESNRPYCLRVVTKEYKNKLYPAATLKDKTWFKLKTDLEKKGIKVKNECV